jgi:tripartite-type tricarboxylate transporter receptor subunit TctC
MSHVTRRTTLAALFATPFAPALAAPGILAPWRPERPVEFTVGFGAGGGTDIVARLFARHLETRLGVPITVVNRPGAGSELGMSHVARSRPDGHTIGLTNMPAFVTIPVERRAQYNLDSFAFVGGIMNDPTGLVVRAGGPIRDVQDLIRRAQAQPEGIVVSTSGIGTDDHLLMAMLSQATGARFTLVHFNGAPVQRTNLMAGHVQVNTMSVGEVKPNPDGLRFMAHAGGAKSRFAPDVPTLKSMGLDIEMYSERGIVMPIGTPSGIVGRMRELVAETAADPATIATFEAQFIEPRYEPGPQWEARMRSTQSRYAELWRRAPWIES